MLVVRIDSTAFSFPLSPRFMSSAGDAHGTLILWTVAVLACLMGLHLVASVGGGDMHLGKKTHFSTVGLRVGPWREQGHTTAVHRDRHMKCRSCTQENCTPLWMQVFIVNVSKNTSECNNDTFHQHDTQKPLKNKFFHLQFGCKDVGTWKSWSVSNPAGPILTYACICSYIYIFNHMYVYMQIQLDCKNIKNHKFCFFLGYNILPSKACVHHRAEFLQWLGPGGGGLCVVRDCFSIRPYWGLVPLEADSCNNASSLSLLCIYTPLSLSLVYLFRGVSLDPCKFQHPDAVAGFPAEEQCADHRRIIDRIQR